MSTEQDYKWMLLDIVGCKMVLDNVGFCSYLHHPAPVRQHPAPNIIQHHPLIILLALVLVLTLVSCLRLCHPAPIWHHPAPNTIQHHLAPNIIQHHLAPNIIQHHLAPNIIQHHPLIILLALTLVSCSYSH